MMEVLLSAVEGREPVSLQRIALTLGPIGKRPDERATWLRGSRPTNGRNRRWLSPGRPVVRVRYRGLVAGQSRPPHGLRPLLGFGRF